jgi:CheY-like chemotaxis protein
MSEPASGGPDLDVLVVSDDPAVREQVRFGFPSGVSVRYARDAREAWRLATSSAPSVVVVDMQTGRAGGFGLTRDLAEDERLAGIPVVILLERPQDGWLAAKAGATSWHTKPLPAMALVRAALAAAATRV